MPTNSKPKEVKIDMSACTPEQRIMAGDISAGMQEIERKVMSLRYKNPYPNKRMRQEKYEELQGLRDQLFVHWENLAKEVSKNPPKKDGRKSK